MSQLFNVISVNFSSNPQLANANCLQFRNNADSAYIDTLCVNASDDTELKADTGNAIGFYPDNAEAWRMDSSDALRGVGAASRVLNHTETNQQIIINGGAGASSSFGSAIFLAGISATGIQGRLLMETGNHANSGFIINMNSTANWEIQQGGSQRVRFSEPARNLVFTGASNSWGIFGSATDIGLDICAGTSTLSSTGACVRLKGNTAFDAGRIFVDTGTDTNAFGRFSANGSAGFWEFQTNPSGGGITNALTIENSGIVNFEATMGTSSVDPSAHVGTDGWVEVQIAGTTKYIPVYDAS